MKVKLCKECGKDVTKFGNSYHSLCPFHNKIRIELNKPIRAIKKKAKKVTGELAMFKEIWTERPHICVHCGDKIYEFSVWCFSHIKPKSTYPKLRLDKNNVELLCVECHTVITREGKEKFERRKDINL